MVSPNSLLLYYYGVVIVSVMALMVIASSYNIFYLLPLFIVVLPILMRGEDSLFVSTYVLVVLALFYSSLNTYSVPLLFILTPIVMRLAGSYWLSRSRVVLSGFGSLSLSSIMVLKFLVVSSLVILLNYHIGLSISLFVLVVLLYSLYRYIGLLRVSLNSVEYPDKIYYGEEKEIRVSISSDKRVLLSISSGDVNRVYWVEGKTVLGISISGRVLGRREFMLRIIVYDKTLCVRRVLAEIPIVIHVVPSYERILDYARRNVLARMDLREILEPVEIRAYILGEREGFVEVSGTHMLGSLLSGLPSYIRSILEQLLKGYFEGRKPYRRIVGSGGMFESGRSKSVLGEYYGTRIFVPGDRLRNIHWKKSISKKKLYVKEYVGGLVSGFSSTSVKGAPVVILDLSVNGYGELDRLIREFLRLLAVSSTSSLLAELSVVVVVGDLAVFVHGKLVDVLNAFSNVLIRVYRKFIYEYESFGTVVSDRVIDDMIKYMNDSPLIGMISYPCINYSRSIAHLLLSNKVLPGRNMIIIHGVSSALKNAFLKYFLENNGYKVRVVSVAK